MDVVGDRLHTPTIVAGQRAATASISTSAPDGQRRDLDRGARGRTVADVARIDLVHRGEVAEILEEDRRLDELLEPAARLLEDRAQVLEHLLGLLCDSRADHLLLARPQPELPGDEDEPAGLHRLVVRRALERRRGLLRPHDLLLCHVVSFGRW